jgi:hypothetical protein
VRFILILLALFLLPSAGIAATAGGGDKTSSTAGTGGAGSPAGGAASRPRQRVLVPFGALGLEHAQRASSGMRG